jgi:HEPN domain-containing protein
MSVDYRDAAERHRADAELLFAHKRWPNADQLYGLAAECGLKAVMKALGMALRPDGAPRAKTHRVHIDRLWDEFRTFATGRGGADFASRLGGNPFHDWRIEQRYAPSVEVTRQAAVRHQQGAERVFTVVEMAVMQGRL